MVLLKEKYKILMIIFFSICLSGLVDPEKIYQEECATCHEGGVTKAPHRMFLEMMPTDAIYSSLTEGVMVSQAKNLGVESKKRLAEILQNIDLKKCNSILETCPILLKDSNKEVCLDS